MTHEDEIAALRAENARLREQLSESHCAARVTEMQKRCTRAEAAERFAKAFCDGIDRARCWARAQRGGHGVPDARASGSHVPRCRLHQGA